VLRRDRDGYRLRLGRDERALLARLARELRDVVAEDGRDPSLERLFPPAAEDAADAADFDNLVRPSLVDAKAAALETLERTAGAERLTAQELEQWLVALNDLRLVLGTRLDVTEDLDERRYEEPGVALYGWLTWVQATVIEAVTEAL
jgi:alkanesulfonate monooxygenase SsuD/methylene tetrahydromethanopterin reductase-like flavin-dependent oxidoreductase (luciferase family)